MNRQLSLLLVLIMSIVLLALPVQAAFDAREADIDKDGLITLEDAQQLARDLATLAAPWRGDINGDAYVRGDDLQLLLALMLTEAMPGDPRITDALVDELIQELMVGQIPPPTEVSTAPTGNGIAAVDPDIATAIDTLTSGSEEVSLPDSEPETLVQIAIKTLRSHRSTRTVQVMQKFCDGLRTTQEKTSEVESTARPGDQTK